MDQEQGPPRIEAPRALNGEIQPIDATLLSNIRSCAACVSSAKEGEDRVCRAKPPQVFMFLIPVMSPIRPGQQGMAPKSVTQFPVVQDDQWCREFEPRMLRKRADVP